jgi:hypothetical protein
MGEENKENKEKRERGPGWARMHGQRGQRPMHATLGRTSWCPSFSSSRARVRGADGKQRRAGTHRRAAAVDGEAPASGGAPALSRVGLSSVLCDCSCSSRRALLAAALGPARLAAATGGSGHGKRVCQGGKNMATLME